MKQIVLFFFLSIHLTANAFEGTKEKIQEEVDILEQETHQHEIVLHNDEVNTFEFVIESLINVCEHTLEQAEQCTLQIHFRGKCGVKTGGFDELVAMRNEICRRGISAEIEASA